MVEAYLGTISPQYNVRLGKRHNGVRLLIANKFNGTGMLLNNVVEPNVEVTVDRLKKWKLIMIIFVVMDISKNNNNYK